MKTVEEILIKHRDNAASWKTLNEFINAVIIPAMEEVAEMSFDAGANYVTHYHSVQHPNKELFIEQLFP